MNSLLMLALLPAMLFCTELVAQDTLVQETLPPAHRSSILAGTQIPLQFTAGYAYRLNSQLSARIQAGIISKPYSGFIVDAMEAYGMDRYLGRVIRKSFQGGAVLGLGPNYHFGKNYVGVYAQYMRLNAGGITPADALSIHFEKDFSQFDLLSLPAFTFTMQSNLFNAGILAGRSFSLRNPRCAINAELGLSKVLASGNSFASNRNLVDQTRFAANLYRELDEEMRGAFWRHGLIPTLNLYFVYHL